RLRRRRSHVEKARGTEERRARLPPRRRQSPQRRCARLRDPRWNAPCECERRIALVAREGFVTTVARKRDRDMPARLLRYQEGRECSLVAERLVVGRRQPRERR